MTAYLTNVTEAARHTHSQKRQPIGTIWAFYYSRANISTFSAVQIAYTLPRGFFVTRKPVLSKLFTDLLFAYIDGTPSWHHKFIVSATHRIHRDSVLQTAAVAIHSNYPWKRKW